MHSVIIVNKYSIDTKDIYSIWVNGWMDITKQEYDVVIGINERICKHNEEITKSDEYRLEQERKEYERLKAKFEGVNYNENK